MTVSTVVPGICPICGSDNVLMVGENLTGRSQAPAHSECNNCGHIWYSHFDLPGWGRPRSLWGPLGCRPPEGMGIREAMREAHLDWNVTTEPAVAVVNGEIVPIPGKYATVRHMPEGYRLGLGIVGERYEVVQNVDAFAICDDIARVGGATYETIGSARNGCVVFVSMKLPHMLHDGGNIIPYLLISNSHDGSRALTIAVTPVRVACTNALTMAVSRASRVFQIRHTSSASERIKEAVNSLELAADYQRAFEEDLERLLNKTYTEEKFERLVAELTGKDENPESSARKKAYETMLSLWGSNTLEGIRGTAWGAYNAVAEYADWYAPIRGGNDSHVRATRLLMGGITEKLKARALKLINLN